MLVFKCTSTNRIEITCLCIIKSCSHLSLLTLNGSELILDLLAPINTKRETMLLLVASYLKSSSGILMFWKLLNLNLLWEVSFKAKVKNPKSLPIKQKSSNKEVIPIQLSVCPLMLQTSLFLPQDQLTVQ